MVDRIKRYLCPRKLLPLAFVAYFTCFLAILRITMDKQYSSKPSKNTHPTIYYTDTKSNGTESPGLEKFRFKELKGGKRAEWDFWDNVNFHPNYNFRNITILMWTKYYNNEDLTDHIRNESPIPHWCNVTFNRSKINQSQAVVFHIPGQDLNLKDLPPRQHAQPWVYYIIEPPIYMARDPKPLNGLFNRTMSYRLDSDFPCPYGYVTKLEKPSPSNPYFSDPNFPRNSKTSLVSWMVSHCSTRSQRETVVKQLQKHIQVDIYGACGTLYCDPKDEEGCYEKLGKKYKFYLSLENSLCTDYITEKFSNALRYNLVPIVYGGGNYSAILPYPKSFINVNDFETMESLAFYLKYLATNETAFSEYFEWRRFHKIHIRQGFDGFRRMCNALQMNENHRQQTYKNISEWWVGRGNCNRQPWPKTT